MRICIDISQSAYKGTGVARYVTSMVKSLMQHDSDNEYVFLFMSLRQKPPKEIADLVKTPHKIVQFPFPPTVMSILWNNLHLIPIERLVGDVDIYVSSDWTQAPTKKARSATVVHDMIPYLFPETSTNDTQVSLQSMNISANIVETHKKRLHWVKKECDVILADSESTKKDLHTILGIDNESISVVYPSVITPKVSTNDIHTMKKSYGLNRPFILTVGKVEPRKNIARLIEAFNKSGLYSSVDLVIAGSKGWGDQPQPDLPSEAHDSIKFLGFVPEEDLYALYASADTFAFVSLYEGFGFPMIEAMTYGCPVVASNISSLGELGKDTALLCDPTSIDSISQALKKAHTDTELRKSLTQKGKSFSKNFTEKKFAQNILDALLSI